MKTSNRRISVVIAGAALLLTGIFTSCKKSSSSGGGGPKPPSNPGGYDSSNQIAPSDLVAYWPFTSSYDEVKSSLAGTNNGASFTAGVKGQAYQGSGSSYVTFSNPGTALPALQSFTVSFWIKANQPIADTGTIVPGMGAQGIFDLVNNTGFWGNLHLNIEPFRSQDGSVTTPNADTLLLKMELTSTATGVVWQNQFPTVWLDSAVGKWTQVVITYNGASGTFTAYENGTITGTNGLGYAYGPFSGSMTLYANDPGSATNTNSAPVLGNLQFANASALVLGTWQLATTPSLTTGAGAQPWATSYGGALDEFRIYKSALNSTDVKSLYILEKAGF